MDFSLPTALEVLNRTPGTLKSMLSGLPSPWTSATEGPDTWSPQDVVGHLIHGEETDWIPRAKIILTKGESQAFEPFDRFAQARRFTGWSLERLLDRFAEARADGIATLRGWHLTREQLALCGRHPDLGQVLPGAAGALRSTSRPGPGDALPAARVVGGARPGPHRPDLACDGEAVHRGRRALEGLSPGAHALAG